MTREELIEVMARALCVDDGVDPDVVGYDRTGSDFPNWYVVQGTAETVLAAIEAAGVNALPKLLDDLKRLRAERDRMREALEKISERHVPDQPAADGSDEADYVRKHHTDLRRIARAAIGETK